MRQGGLRTCTLFWRASSSACFCFSYSSWRWFCLSPCSCHPTRHTQTPTLPPCRQSSHVQVCDESAMRDTVLMDCSLAPARSSAGLPLARASASPPLPGAGSACLLPPAAAHDACKQAAVTNVCRLNAQTSHMQPMQFALAHDNLTNQQARDSI
jgi:hypothetical protein